MIKTSNSDNAPIRTHVNKMEKRITLNIKTGYYLELLTPETIKLRRITKRKTEKRKNVSHLESAKVVFLFIEI